MPHYLVTVGNVGTVSAGPSQSEADSISSDYVSSILENKGRAEWPVCIFRDGDLIAEIESADPTCDDTCAECDNHVIRKTGERPRVCPCGGH